jgi:hypothetical protein
MEGTGTSSPIYNQSLKIMKIIKRNAIDWAFANSKADIRPAGLFGNSRVSKKNMNWRQAKARYSRLNPYGDADRDRVRNRFDCRPFDRKRQDEILLESPILEPPTEDSFLKPPISPVFPITPPGWMHKVRHFQGKGESQGLRNSGRRRFFSKEEMEEDITQGKILNKNMGNMNVGLKNSGNMNMGNMNVDGRLNGPRTEKKGPF